MSAWPSMLIGWLVFCQLTVHAQLDQVSLKFEKKELTAVNEEISDLTVKIKNGRRQFLNAKVVIELSPGLELVSKNNFLLRLKPGDSTYLPLKVFIGQRAQSGVVHELRAALMDSLKQVLGKDTCKIRIGMKRNVLLYTQVANLLLESSTDSIRIPVRVLNMGNTVQKISLVAGYPSTIDGGDFQTAMQLVLPALKDTIVSFNKRVNRRMFMNEGFDVNVTGLYANGELFNMAYVKIQSARTNRSYEDLEARDSYENNSLSLSTQGMFGPNEAYLFLGRGSMELPKGKLSYHLDASFYKNSRFSPTSLRNTYLAYENGVAGLKAGNINKNLDINLSGKGGEFFYNDTAGNNRYTAGYMRSGTNLLGDHYFGSFSSGQSAWASIAHTAQRWQWNTDAIYELNPFLNANNFLLNNQLRLKSKNFRYSLMFNGGRSAEYLYGNKIRFGLAGGLDMNGNIKGFSINSINYFSTGYYPGMRQGAVSFSERLVYTNSRGSIWLSLDYYNYKPKRISGFALFNPTYGSFRIEAGASQKIFGKATISVSPFYSSESNNSFQFISSKSNPITLASWNIGATLNIPLSAEQYCSLNFENGIYSSSIDPRTRFHLKSNANYRYRFFNLNATVQAGSFYIAELLNSQPGVSSGNYLINVTPSVQHKLMRNRMRIELGLNYSNTKFSGKGLQLTGRTEYEFLPGTVMFAAANHNRYTFINGQYQSSILEMGITKKLPRLKVGTQLESMQVFLYKDINQNGVYDALDSVAVNYLVYINDVVFATRSDGTINYKHLPPGEYLISLPRLKDWYAPEQRINFRTKQRIEIPLQKTGTLKGGISYSFNEFSYEVGQQKEGVLVIATAENGQVYTTRTNFAGQYVFYLPVGKYELNINMEALAGEVECKDNGLVITVPDGGVKHADLSLHIKQRKVETKRFVSPSLKK